MMRIDLSLPLFLCLSVSPSLYLSVSPSLRLSVSLSLCLSVSPSLRPSVSSRKRLPVAYPIVILRPGEVLFVIVNGRLAVGVAGIVILAAELARVPDRLEHREDAEAALRFRRLEHRIDRRGGLASDVQEAGGEEPGAVVDTNLPVAAWLDRRLFGKEVVNRVGNVLFESLAVAIEQPLLDLVYERVADDDAEVQVPAPDAPLAARRREFRQIDAQRHDRAEAAPVERGRIAKEVISEMAPAERPQGIHLFRRRPRANEILVDEAHLNSKRIIPWEIF